MLKQSIELARAPNYPETLARTADALAALRKHHADGTLPLLRLPEKRNDISPILGYARLLQENTTDVVWLGTGGSSLGGQTLAQLAGHAVPALGALRKPRLHFMDNLDPGTFEAMLEQLPLATTRFVAISKSGGTAETLMQTAAVIAALQAAKRDPHDHLLGLSEPAKPGQAQRPARSARSPRHPDAGPRPRRRRPLLGAQQRRPPARRGMRPRHRRDPCRRGGGAARRS